MDNSVDDSINELWDLEIVTTDEVLEVEAPQNVFIRFAESILDWWSTQTWIENTRFWQWLARKVG